MRIMPTQDEINHRKGVWQTIKWRMNAHRVTPKQLAYQTRYSQELIERGISGEPVPITSAFLRACVMAFGLTSGRTKYYEDTVEILSDDELKALLKPEPAMPPRQGNFWDYDE